MRPGLLTTSYCSTKGVAPLHTVPPVLVMRHKCFQFQKPFSSIDQDPKFSGKPDPERTVSDLQHSSDKKTDFNNILRTASHE
jgi:hypothetical protein